MSRSIDHSAVLLPELQGRPRDEQRPVRVGRILLGFLFVVATGCVIALLAVSWRNELHKHHAAQAAASTSSSALQSAQGRLTTLEEQNQELSSRVSSLRGDLRTARQRLTPRTAALQDARGILRSTAIFVAALDGLDETIGDTIDDQAAIGKLKIQLARHLGALDRYVRITAAGGLQKSTLRARMRFLTKDLVALQTVLARISDREQALDDTVEPLGQTEQLDKALTAALTRAKVALRR